MSLIFIRPYPRSLITTNTFLRSFQYLMLDISPMWLVCIITTLKRNFITMTYASMRTCTTVTASTGICTGRLYIIGRSIINSPFLISRYDYIANIDTDEIFVPRHPFKNWVEMMQNVSSSHPGHSDYSFISYYIFEQTLSRKGYFVDIPEYLYMLQNIHRSSNYVPRGKHTI